MADILWITFLVIFFKEKLVMLIEILMKFVPEGPRW